MNHQVNKNRPGSASKPKPGGPDGWNIVHIAFTIGILIFILFQVYTLIVQPIQQSGMLMFGLSLILTAVRLMALVILLAAFAGFINRQRMGWIGLRAVSIFMLLSFLTLRIMARVMEASPGMLPDGQDIDAFGLSPFVLIQVVFFLAAFLVYNSEGGRKAFQLQKDDGNITWVLGVSLWILEVLVSASSGFVVDWYLNSFL